MRERDTYRANLERICQAFPGKELLCVSDLVRFLGISRKAVTNTIKMLPNKKITVASLASQLSDNEVRS